MVVSTTTFAPPGPDCRGAPAVSDEGPQNGIPAPLHRHRAATLLQVCKAFTALLPATGAAIVERSDVNRQEVICATDDVSERLETLEFSLGEGPCIQAAHTGRPVLVSDLHKVDHSRWPIFAEAAGRTPARGFYSFPLRIGMTSVGVLNLYRDQPGSLTAAERSAALACAEVALRKLVDLHGGALDERSQRAQIHQATGMVMAQLEISPESSLATLRAYAYSSGQRLDDVARQIITRRLHFPIGGP